MGDPAVKQSYKDLSHPRMKETIHSHLFSTLRLVKLVAEFAHKISLTIEASVNEMHHAVGVFKKKSAELHKHFDSSVLASSSVMLAWEAMLGAVEADAEKQSELSAYLSRNVYNRLLELSLYKKVHISQLFSFREHCEALVTSSREALQKSHENYRSHVIENGSQAASVKDSKSWESCVNAHNDYVLQLCATNEITRQHSEVALPSVLEDLEAIQLDTSNAVYEAIQTFASLTVSKARDQCSRYEHVFSACKRANAQSDLIAFVGSLGHGSVAAEETVGSLGHGSVAAEETVVHPFMPPAASHPQAPECLQKCEIALDKQTEATLKAKRLRLQKERGELLTHAEHLRDALRSLQGQYQRHKCDQNYPKCYELQSEISKQKSDIELSALRLTTVMAQIALLSKKQECYEKDVADKAKTEKSKTSKIKEMWKRFASKARKPAQPDRSLLERNCAQPSQPNYSTPGTSTMQAELSSERDSNHLTGSQQRPVITITSPENPHEKSDSILFRASSIPSAQQAQLVKRQNDAFGSPNCGTVQPPLAASSVACQKPKLKSLGMKSFSLETPDAPRAVDHSSRNKSSSYTSSAGLSNRPGATATAAQLRRRLILSHEKSASIDESDVSCMSAPIKDERGMRGSGDIFVAVKDFKPKKRGDLELRAGQRVNVLDASDPEWWLGRTGGHNGFFSSDCVMSLYPGQRVFKVEKPLHLNDGGRDVRLTADQIVVEAGKEDHGVVTIRTHSSKMQLLSCPMKYLVEL